MSEKPKSTISAATLVPPKWQPAQQQKLDASKLSVPIPTVLTAPILSMPSAPQPPNEVHTSAEQMIDAGGVLDEIAATLKKHVIMSESASVAATLWIGMTHFINVIQVAPLGLISAPEKACGKSQLLTLFGLLVKNPMPVANCSPSFIFRSIEKSSPTLLIDEADTFFKGNSELSGIINAGHTRDQAFVGRTVADGKGGFDPERFSVWCAKAFAGIAMERHLPSATMSRCIPIQLNRKTATEQVARLRQSDRDSFMPLADRIAKFAEQNQEKITLARPSLPDELSDREQDNWEPLIAIAELAGPRWGARARAAAIEISRHSTEPNDTGNELLSDIHEIFFKAETNKLGTAELIEWLCADLEAPWATYNRGRPITPRQLAQKLATYDPNLRPKTVRLGTNNTPKGYDLDQFADVFLRYLPQRRNDTPQSIRDNEPAVADAPATPTSVADTARTISTQPDPLTDASPTPQSAKAKLWEATKYVHTQKTSEAQRPQKESSSTDRQTSTMNGSSKNPV